MAILLKNGLVYQEGEFIKEDVLISGSKIQAIGLDLPEEGAEVYDLKGKLLAPGLVDIHEHYREPGFTYKETIKTGSEAASRGGFTTVCTMPNVDPVPDDLETFEKQVALNEANSCVHLKQYGAITEDLTSDQVVDMAALKEAGAFAFSNDGHGIQQAGTMYEAMQEAAKVGLAICEHIQDDSLYHHGVMNAGKKAEELGLPGILGVSESAQLARDLVLAQAGSLPCLPRFYQGKRGTDPDRQGIRNQCNRRSRTSPPAFERRRDRRQQRLLQDEPAA